MRNTTKRIALWGVLVAAALMIPALGNWPWTGSDYIVAAALLCGAAVVYEVAALSVSSTRRRAAVGVAVAALLVWIWAELAVGVFTNWGS